MRWLVQVQDIHVRSSLARTARLAAARVTSEAEARRWLGDEEGELAVFRTSAAGGDVLVTVATGGSGSVFGYSHDRYFICFSGIFNMKNGHFHLYNENPRHHDPIITMNIEPKDCLTDMFSLQEQ